MSFLFVVICTVVVCVDEIDCLLEAELGKTFYTKICSEVH